MKRLACAALIGLVAGCGGGGAKAHPVLTPDRAGDKAIARAATLRIADFPAGWKQGSANPSNTASCTEIEAAKDLTSARVTGPDFSHGTFSHVQNSIYLFPDERAARTAYAGLTGDATRTCYAATVTHAFSSQPGVKVGKARAEGVPMDELGDERVAARVTVPLSAAKVRLDIAVDLVFVRVNRGVSIGLFIDAPQAFEDELRARLSATTANRLTDELS